MRRWTLLGSILLWFTSFVAEGGKLYWTDRRAGKVQRANVDGSDIETLIQVNSTNLRGIAIDVANDRLFYADNGSGKIFRTKLDGSESLEIASDLGFPADITLDLSNQKLYWCDQQRGVIERADIDGTERETVIETSSPYYLELDIPNNFLYWGDFEAGNINRMLLDGGTPINLFTGQPRIRGVKLDRNQNELFWCNRQSNHIQRRKVDKETVTTVISNLDTPHGLVIDPVARKAYWCDTGTDRHNEGGKAINRADLDGKDTLEQVVALNEPWDADLDLRTSTYADYVARYFRIERTKDETSWQGDFDGDGYVQLLEYGLASHPERTDIVPITTINLSDGHPVFVYQRFENATDVDYVVEVSDDLETWQSNASATVAGPETTASLGGGLLRVSLPILSSAKHLRLRVTLRP